MNILIDVLGAFAILAPHGPVALAERDLMVTVILFMLIVAVPVITLLFFFAWRYRAGNTKAKYAPEWHTSTFEELVWWAIPLEIILILGALTWSSTHALDPKKPLSQELPLVVQVVALDWKWLFIYPEESVATVNYVALEVGRPVRFLITADAPMNSFWIPQLGGQIYAMTGMTTELNLLAERPGRFKGLSANYSGEHFADMQFVAEALPPEEFKAWAERARGYERVLSMETYEELSRPSVEKTPLYFGFVADGLYTDIVAQFGALPQPTHYEH